MIFFFFITLQKIDNNQRKQRYYHLFNQKMLMHQLGLNKNTLTDPNCLNRMARSMLVRVERMNRVERFERHGFMVVGFGWAHLTQRSPNPSDKCMSIQPKILMYFI